MASENFGFGVAITEETADRLLASGDIDKKVYIGGKYGGYCVLAYPPANGEVGFVKIDGVCRADAKTWSSGIKYKYPDVELVVTIWP